MAIKIRTLVDDDSDEWIFKVLDPRLFEELEQLKSTHQWTNLINSLLGKLHPSRAAMECALQQIPINHIHFRRVFDMLKLHEANMFIFSDANEYFIQHILHHHDLLEPYFQRVVSNPVEWVRGQLRVHWRTPKHESHGCENACPPNFCKSFELDKVINEKKSNSPIIFYCGDGNNDFCPARRLSPKDHLFAREGFVLARLCMENRDQIKANLYFWKTAEDLLEKMQQVLNRIGEVAN